MYFSAMSNAFFPANLQPTYEAVGCWPNDAIEISKGEYRKYGQGEPPAGYKLGADQDGRPAWVEQEPTPLDEVAADKLAMINAAATRALADIRREYPQFEIDTWSDQEAEARAWTADNSAATPTLSGIAAERGVTVAELAPKVIEKADLYRPMATTVIGKRQRLEDAIKAAEKAGDREAVEAIGW